MNFPLPPILSSRRTPGPRPSTGTQAESLGPDFRRDDRSKKVFTLGFFVFVALALLALPTPAPAQAIDWNGYCSPSAKRVLLLVDITTPYDTQDKQILVDGLQSIVGKLGDGDRIVIRTIADSYTHTEKLIDRCMPYCPPMSFWDELFSNCTGGLILNHKRTLIAEIRASVRGKLDQFKELEHSEIVGTIAQSAKEVLSPEQGAEVYIFSDLIENSEYIPGGAFREEPNAALIARIEADNFLPNLEGAAVKIFGVGRGGGEERAPLSVPRLNKLLDFWNTLFERSGAAPVTISQNLVAD
jgi:hypothetical protein